MKKTSLLFLVILLEGYVVLACELLAIRQLIPFVGSGTEVVAIIISGVLLPLAIGYDQGGKAYPRLAAKARARSRKTPSIRNILLKNLLKALLILALGFSYPVLQLFFGLINIAGIHHRLPQTALYVLLFLVTPVFLLGQTVPLVSNYFSRRRLSEITGKMLFFSTTGSFFGSIFSTIILMSAIGVHNTVIVTLGLLCLLCLLLAGRNAMYERCLALCLFAMVWLANSTSAMQSFHVVSDNAYNTVSIIDIPSEQARILDINHSTASKVGTSPDQRFTYIKYTEDQFITPTIQPGAPARDILVIGAGGFTLGLTDTQNKYTFVDIDKSLKDIAETYFLPEKLTPNKKFIAASARAFVHSADKQYDLIFLDTFTNTIAIPMETITREYLQETRKLLKPGGALVANIAALPDFSDTFTIRYDNTFSSVFPRHTRQIIADPVKRDTHSPTAIREKNILYIFNNTQGIDDNTIYTDDKNTYSLDRN